MVCLDREKKSYSFQGFFSKPENPYSTSQKPELKPEFHYLRESERAHAAVRLENQRSILDFPRHKCHENQTAFTSNFHLFSTCCVKGKDAFINTRCKT
jgi:hypothetical protein